jgi:hypothetical protein
MQPCLALSFVEEVVGWWTFDGKDVLGIAPTSSNTASIFPGTAGTLSGGSLFWANTGNVLADDSSYADVTLSGTAQSNYLRASNFGFSIPANATIVGIEGDIKRRRIGGTLGDARDYSVRLVDDTGAFVGSDKAWTATNWPITGDWACNGVGCYGGPADMWSTTLTPAQVNDPDFGMALQATGDAAGANRQALVDAIDMVIYYTIPGGVLDRSGSGNHGSITGARGAAGKVGQGMQFDGVDDAVTVDTISALTGASDVPFSWSFWVNVTVPNVNEIISWGPGRRCRLTNINANYGVGCTVSGDEYDGFAVNSATKIDDGKWHHVVYTHDSVTQKLYIDGALEDTGTESFGTGADIFQFGTRPFGGYFEGKIDDVRVYNRTLSFSEIKKIYNEGGGITIGKSQSNLVPSGLVGYWSFNGTDFTDRVYDRSGQGNHGDVVGIATSTVKAIGKIGQGAYLNGANGTVDFADTASLQLSSSGSIALWVKPKELEPDWDVLVNHIHFTTDRNGYALFIDRTQDGSHFNLEIANASSFDRITSASSASAGKWQFVVGTWDGSNLRIYVDGVQEGSPVAQTVNATPSYALNFGSDIFNSYHPKGTLDEVRIYNRALTAAEVKRLYQTGK